MFWQAFIWAIHLFRRAEEMHKGDGAIFPHSLMRLARNTARGTVREESHQPSRQKHTRNGAIHPMGPGMSARIAGGMHDLNARVDVIQQALRHVHRLSLPRPARLPRHLRSMVPNKNVFPAFRGTRTTCQKSDCCNPERWRLLCQCLLPKFPIPRMLSPRGPSSRYRSLRRLLLPKKTAFCVINSRIQPWIMVISKHGCSPFPCLIPCFYFWLAFMK